MLLLSHRHLLCHLIEDEDRETHCHSTIVVAAAATITATLLPCHQAEDKEEGEIVATTTLTIFSSLLFHPTT